MPRGLQENAGTVLWFDRTSDLRLPFDSWPHVKLENRKLLIVGASSGIAAEAAWQIADRENTIGLVARREDKLKQVSTGLAEKGCKSLYWAADATDPAEMTRVFCEANEAMKGLDVVWVNAGQGPDMSIADCSASDISSMIRLNYEVLVNCLVPAMECLRKSGGGQIVHTNSLAGLLGIPRQGPYGAAKAAARHLMDTARAELEPENLRFTSLFPGFVATERIASDGLPKPLQISVETAARKSLAAIESEKRNAFFPLTATSLLVALKALPPSIRNPLLRRSLPSNGS